MPPIAILGATSWIARDFLAGAKDRDFHLFGRSGATRPYSEFGKDVYSAIINFVGVGDPSRAREMGRDIFSVTREFDELALAYLERRPGARYIFLSSGAVYGRCFSTPAAEDSLAPVPINDLRPEDWYGEAKRYAEALHRSLSATIFDIRVFNYISRTVDLSARFLITDMINAIREGHIFTTSDRPLSRDYLHPWDFRQIVECCLVAPTGTNLALDCYSQSAITKTDLLALMTREFGMKVKIAASSPDISATGEKPHYYSRNHRAVELGYAPIHSSRSAIIEEVAAILARGS